jgi:outer membrane protein
MASQAVGVAQETHRCTLPEALEYAWAHQAKMRIAQAEVRGAEAQVEAARGALLPQVSAAGGYTYNGKLPTSVIEFSGLPFPTMPDGVPSTEGQPQAPAPAPTRVEVEFGAARDYRAAAQVQQPLFTWGKLRNAYRQAKENLEATRWKWQTAQRDVALSVTEAFYGVLLTREVAAVAQSGREQAQRRLDTTERRIAAGTATRLDLLQARVALANAETQVIRAENALRLARQGLALALGMSPADPVEADGALEFAPTGVDLDALLAAAMARRSDLLELRMRERAAGRLVDIAKAGNKPNLGFTGTYAASDNERQDAQTVWFLSVGVNIPLFDGFATRARTRQAEAAQRHISLGQEALADAVVFQVHQAYGNYAQARAVLAAQEEAVAQAEEALRIANVSYENGAITSVELADVELAHTAARLGRAQAVHDALVAHATVAHAAGGALP